MLSPTQYCCSSIAPPPAAALPPSTRLLLLASMLHVPHAAAQRNQHVHFDPAPAQMWNPLNRNMMQAPAMMPAGGSWMAYQDREGRPCWHNTATNEWTYNLSGGGVMMGVPPPQPQIVGYVPAPQAAAPVGMYGWQVAAPAATMPAPGQIFYGPPGAAVMPAAGPYGPAAAQQMMYAQQIQQMQQMQQMQHQQGMMAAAYQQQQLQLQRSGSDGGMFGGPPSMQRSGSDGGMFGGPPSMMDPAAAAAAAGLVGGVAGYSMMPDPNGPDAAAWIGPGPADGSRPFPNSHKARGSIPMPPFDPSHMHLPAWFAGGAGAAVAGDAAGGTGGISGSFGGMFPPGMVPPVMKGKKGKKGKKKDGEEGESEGKGGEGKDDSGEQDKAPPAAAAAAVSDSDSDDDDDDDDDDGDDGDVAKEVMASSAAAAAAAAGIAAAVARSDKETSPPEGDVLDQREPGGGGNDEEDGAGEAGKGVWVSHYDGDGGQWWRNTVTGARANEDPYV